MPALVGVTARVTIDYCISVYVCPSCGCPSSFYGLGVLHSRVCTGGVALSIIHLHDNDLQAVYSHSCMGRRSGVNLAMMREIFSNEKIVRICQTITEL